MIDEIERASIIEEAINKSIEKMLLTLPETMGNLIASHVALNKINTKFYADYPEFKDKKDVVATIVEMVEGKNPLESYENILKQAVPEIRERINTLKNLNMTTVTNNPDRDFKSIDAGNLSLRKSNNGEI